MLTEKHLITIMENIKLGDTSIVAKHFGDIRIITKSKWYSDKYNKAGFEFCFMIEKDYLLLTINSLLENDIVFTVYQEKSSYYVYKLSDKILKSLNSFMG